MDQERRLLFTVHKWQAKAVPAFSNIHYEIISDLELNVYDTSGHILATSSTKDFTEKKQDMGVRVKHLQEMASEVLKKKIREMLNDASVRRALE